MFMFCLSAATISGDNILGYGQNVSSVSFGNIPAIVDYSSLSNSSVSVRVQANNNTSPGMVRVRIISDTGAIVQSQGLAWTYLVPGEITSNTPLEGQAGTRIEITGTNLLGGGILLEDVFVDGVPATVLSASNTIVLIIPADFQQRQSNIYPGQILLQSDTGAVIFGGNYTHRESGVIESFFPARGRRGTRVTVTGRNLLGYSSGFDRITLAGVAVSQVEFFNSTQMVVRANFSAAAQSGPIMLTLNTGALITSTTNFTYDEPGVLTSVTPTAGAEGTSMSILGSGLLPENVQIRSITIGGVPVSRTVTISDTAISVIVGPAPPSNPDNAEIRITASDDSFIDGVFFSFMNFELSLPGVSLGREGTLLDIILPNASQFEPSMSLKVTVDDQAAEIVSLDTAQLSLVVRAPRARSHGAYTADVAIEGMDGIIARLRNGFTYLSGGLICEIEPSEGQVGTVVTLRGENFFGGARNLSSAEVIGQQVDILSYTNTSAVVQLQQVDSSLSFPVTGDVVLTGNTGAVLRRLNGFTLRVPGNVTSVDPPFGQNATTVTIRVTGLSLDNLNIANLTLAGIPASVIGTAVELLQGVVVTVRAGPSSASTALRPVIITLNTGEVFRSSRPEIMFGYLAPGNITSVSPGSGTVGTRVLIQGTDLLQGGLTISQVLLNGVPAQISSFSNLSINVVAQDAASPGLGDVTIVSDTGATLTGLGLWSYNDLGAILQVSPNISQQGALVNITGFSLLGSASAISECWLAGVRGTVVPPASDSSVRCLAGNVPFSAADMTGFVVLLTDTGVLINSSEANVTFTYYASSIDSLSTGQGNNGTIINITGVSLFSGPDMDGALFAVRLGSIDATVLSSSPNEIVVAAGFSGNSSVRNSIRIESTSGTFLELSNAWSYTEPGDIISIAPKFGFAGTEVEVFGDDLFPQNEAPFRIVIGETLAYNVTVINSSTAIFRPNLSGSPEEELPVQIISSTGRTVFDPTVTFYYNQSSATVLSVTPTSGSEGSVVVISGEDLPDASAISTITLAGVSTTIVSVNDSEIVVTAGEPPSSGTTGPVVIETFGLIVGLRGNAWTYFPIVNSSNVRPNTGQNGTVVTIDLSAIDNLPPIERVSLSGIDAEISGLSRFNTLTVTAGLPRETMSRSLGDVQLLLSNNITINIFNAWTYQGPVMVNELLPSTGYFGTSVTIRGSMFMSGGNVTVTEVFLAGAMADVVAQNSTYLQVTLSEAFLNSTEDTVGPVVIIADDGATYTSEYSLNFTYLSVNVLEISPTNGSSGTLVTLRGDNMLAGGSSFASFTVAGIGARVEPGFNSSIISFAVGVSSTGTNLTDIRYTMNTGAVVVIPNSWSYLEPGQITFITPSAGTMGTIVSITGRRLFGGGTRANAVYLNGILAAEILSNFDNFIRVRAPPGSGFGGVRIISDTQAVVESPSHIEFTFLDPAVFFSISPSEGQNGTIVNITGVGFHAGEGIARVFLAGTEARIVSIAGSSIIVQAGRPSNVESIARPVVVQSIHNSTSVSSTQLFTYRPEGVVLSVTPDRGRNNTLCRIAGENLFGGGSEILNVTLDGVTASIINQSLTTLYVSASLPPSANASTGNIVLISDTNSYVTRVDGWTNVAQGSIDSIAPEMGQFGTRVTITGQNLLSGGSSLNRVQFDDTYLFDISFASNNLVRARIGQPEVSYEFVSESVVFVSNYNSELYLEYSWSFLNQSNITELLPPVGLSNTTVNITGTNLLGGGSQIVRATVAGIPARVMSFSDESVVIVTGENGGGMEMLGELTLESDTGAMAIDEWQYQEECPNNTYFTDGMCMDCDEQCTRCIGPSNFNCSSCLNFAILTTGELESTMECVSRCPNVSTLDNVCVDACAPSQFARVNTERNSVFCYNCSDLCDPNLGCTGPAPSQCNGCQFFLSVVNQTCVEDCAEEEYYINQTKECRPCHQQCSGGCRGPTEQDCTSCSELTVVINQRTVSTSECRSTCPGLFYEDMSTKRCFSCDSNCLSGCTNSAASSCTDCRGPYFSRSGVRECVADCGVGHYRNLATSECQKCSDLCHPTSNCSGPNPSECDRCSLNHQGDCVSDCPVTHYANNLTLLCEECDNSCGTRGCVGSKTNCNAQQGPFIAGGGTIGVVIVIIIALVVIIIVLVLFLVWVLKIRDHKYSPNSMSYHGDNNTDNVNPVRYSMSRGRSQIQDISTDIPLKSIETESHVRNPMYEDDTAFEDNTPDKKKLEYVMTKSEEANMPEKNQPISASQDLYMDMDAESAVTQERSVDEEKKTLLTKEPSLPEKNQPVSASQDLYMDMDSASPSEPSTLTEEQIEESKRQSLIVENKQATSGANNESKTVQYTKIYRGSPLPEKNQPTTGSQDLYTDVDATPTLIEEVSASQDVYTDMEMGPPSILARDHDVAPILPPKPTLKPPISVPPKESSIPEHVSKKPPIPQKTEKPLPPGPPAETADILYTDMDGGVTEVFMNPIADTTYVDMGTSPPSGTSAPTSPSVPLIDDSLYEDTDSSDFLDEYRKSMRDMKLPPVPEESAAQKKKNRQSAPALPSAPIPKKRTSIPLPETPLRKSLSSASAASMSTSPTSTLSRPQSVASVPEEETLYDDIPGMSEQPLVPPPRSAPAKTKPAKKKSKGKPGKK